jgi:hypothetical protein
MAFRCLFPQIETGFRLPADLVTSLENAYDETLKARCPGIDARRSAEARVTAAAFLALAGTDEDLALLDRPQEYVSPSTLRSRLRHRLNVFLELSGETPLFPDIARIASRLLDRLPAAAGLPTYPAFRRERSICQAVSGHDVEAGGASDAVDRARPAGNV